MNRFMKAAVGALVAGATIATAAAPAAAAPRGWHGGGWHGGWHGGGWGGYRGGWGGWRGGYYRPRYYYRDHSGAILGAGVAGLALGAVIANSNRPYYGGYYRDGYYDGYDDECYSRRVWDPYIGRYVWSRTCY